MDTTRTRLSGNGGVIRAGKKGGKWNFAAEGHYRSPGLNLNDMGYIVQSDYTGERLEVSYEMNEPTKKIRNYTLEIFQEGMWSFGGERNMIMAGADFDISGIKL